MNVIIGKGQHSGWDCGLEYTKALPFGMDTIVAQNSPGEIEIPEGSREAEQALWDAVISKAPPVVLDNLEIVQDALHIGALIFAFQEKHLEGPNPGVGFLAGVLTYRLPQL